MMTFRSHAILTALTLIICPVVWAQPGNPDLPVYRRGGFSSMTAMGQTLYKGLSPKLQEQLHARPVSLVTDVMPYVHPEEVQYPDLPKPMRLVFISVGFVDLVNYVAHAKAIDRIEKGFFPNYVLKLSQETGDKELAELPKLADPKYWTDRMMNEQESNFSQMVGIVLAIEMSHHYLGHCQKYADKLKDAKGQPVPVNKFLTPDEWEMSLKAGLRNALDRGYGVDGVLALYEAIEKMPQRPAWTVYFLPDWVKVAKLRKDLKRIEENFFAGRDVK